MKRYMKVLLLISAIVGSSAIGAVSNQRAGNSANGAKTLTSRERQALHAQPAYVTATAPPTSSYTNGKLLQQVTRQYTPLFVLLGIVAKQFPFLVEDFIGNVHRLALAGCVNAMFLVTLGAPQAVNLSKGLLPKATPTDVLLILLKALPMQTMLKTIQFFFLRVLKNGLDKVPWMPNKTVNTLISFGLTATILQCASYNNVIMNTYSHFKVTRITSDDGEVKFAPVAFWNFLKANVFPGIEFSFVRECFATGLGLILGPHVRTLLRPLIGTWEPVPAKIVSGIVAGSFCATLTQWLHNNALAAGGIYQVTGTSPSALSVLKSTWDNLGVRMFYLNMNQRALTIAGATVILTLVDVFA